MSKQKLITLAGLKVAVDLIDGRITSGDAKALKTVLFDKTNRKLNFYKKEDAVASDEADFSITLPEEQDISGLLEKITSGVKDNMVMIGENGTVVDSGIPSSSVVKRNELETVETKVGDVTKLNTTSKTDLVGAINEVFTAVGTGGTASVVTITTDTTTEGALKSYTLKQGTNTIGVIDIPKDLVVTSGSVEVDPEGQTAGTYIKLVIANQTDPLYINVGTLVDIYVAKQNATQIQLAIDSSTREISATIVAGSVGSTELADDAVTTVKIADANVTLAKLAEDVKKHIEDTASAKAKELVDPVTERVAALEGKIGDGFEFATNEEIAALFATAE